MEALTHDVNEYAAANGQPCKSKDEVSMGFVQVANEAMCRPIRALTQMKVRMHGYRRRSKPESPQPNTKRFVTLFHQKTL